MFSLVQTQGLLGNRRRTTAYLTYSILNTVIFHYDKREVEIAYLGILEEYHNKKLGSYLLSEAIKKSFKSNIDRVWLHTCSLDHKNALSNYIARGMKIFKEENLNIRAS